MGTAEPVVGRAAATSRVRHEEAGDARKRKAETAEREAGI
jgi:hypothetical protein